MYGRHCDFKHVYFFEHVTYILFNSALRPLLKKSVIKNSLIWVILVV